MAWMVPIALWGLDKIATHFGDDDDDGMDQQSMLTPGQRRIQRNLERALRKPGAGGAYGDIADYYRDLMADESKGVQRATAPEFRKFNEEIIPDLSEQFAGMGAGNLSSSGFRNAAVSAGTDLSERVAGIRENLKLQGAQGFANLGSQALRHNVENTMKQPQATGTENLAQGLGQVAPQVAMQYYQSQNQQNQIQNANAQNKAVGLRNSSPYGKRGQAAGMQPQVSGNNNLPTFLGY